MGEPSISFTSTSQHVPQQNNFGSYFEGTIQDLNPSNSCLVRLFPCRAIGEPNEKRLFLSGRLTRTHKMIRVDSIHKTLLQFLPTWDVPTAKILRNRMIHFREHDKPNRNQDRWSPQVCLRRSTESGSVHSSKVWFRVIGSIGSGKGRVVGKAIPPLSTTATWRLEPSGFTFTESRHSHSVNSSLSTHLGMDRCVPLYMRDVVTVKFFQRFTPSAGMQARYMSKFQTTRNKSKSQPRFWTKSAVFARVCYGCGPLWVSQASRTFGSGLKGWSVSPSSSKACNWNKLHTLH